MATHVPSKAPLPTTERDDLTQEELWARAEGLGEGGMSRTIQTDPTNNGRLEGNIAVPNRQTSSPVAVQAKDHHVGIGDKVKGQIKIAKGILKHDPNLTQEGEILKSDGEDVTIGKPHMDAKHAREQHHKH